MAFPFTLLPPEVQRLVVESIDHSTRPSAIFVCKDWFDWCIDALWQGHINHRVRCNALASMPPPRRQFYASKVHYLTINTYQQYLAFGAVSGILHFHFLSKFPVPETLLGVSKRDLDILSKPKTPCASSISNSKILHFKNILPFQKLLLGVHKPIQRFRATCVFLPFSSRIMYQDISIIAVNFFESRENDVGIKTSLTIFLPHVPGLYIDMVYSFERDVFEMTRLQYEISGSPWDHSPDVKVS